MSRPETIGEERARIGAHRRLTLPRQRDRYKRRGNRRTSRFQIRVHRELTRARQERFGLDVAGDTASVAETKRVMRNARKRERQGR